MSDGGLLFMLLSLFAASLLFAGNAFVRATVRRREEQLRRELPVTVDEDPRPSAMPLRADAKADGNFWLWGLGGGGLVFLGILSWTG